MRRPAQPVRRPAQPVTVSATAPDKKGPFTNSLGMKFVSVPGTKVLFCVWLTRVRDFERFIKETGYNPPGGLTNGFSLAKKQLKQRGDSWKHPGFSQTLDHPVCMVSYDDANKFCNWLTRNELGAGLLKPGHTYRLPTDAEWSDAVGPTKYPWGVDYPPTSRAGNYAGREVKNADWPDDYGILQGYYDGYARTSPVGAFRANSFGLFDMGGNLSEWCDDFYRKEMNDEETRKQIPALGNDGGGRQFRVMRGASWFGNDPALLASSVRFRGAPGVRNSIVGFRCVLEGSSSP